MAAGYLLILILQQYYLGTYRRYTICTNVINFTVIVGYKQNGGLKMGRVGSRC